MTHTFTNKASLKSFRGFTLIELLVVIAIIGLLSTIIAAPIQNARKKARDAKKIAEIKSTQLALDQYAEANAGQYPVSLIPLSPTFMPLLPSFASTSLASISNRDKFAYSSYTVGAGGIGTNVDFGYHLGVHLETYSQGLDNDRDCLGAGNTATFEILNGTSTCAFYPAVGATVSASYGTTTAPLNYVPGMIPTTANPGSGAAGVGFEDFSGSDGDITKCNATTDCVFDVSAQQ
jgi:prepilin-type N-terminal cleavage/methylation domain-containing protein